MFQHHAAYGLNLNRLDVIVVDDSRPMHAIIRSILTQLRPARIRQFEQVNEALEAMANEPPNLIIADWCMAPISGLQLLRSIRQYGMRPVCFIPVLTITAHATRDVIQKAFLAGAQQILVKPLSPTRLIERINFIMRDSRRMLVGRDGHVSIEGTNEIAAQLEERNEMMQRAQQLVEDDARRRLAQSVADELLRSRASSDAAVAVPQAPSAPEVSDQEVVRVAMARARAGGFAVVAKPFAIRTG